MKSTLLKIFAIAICMALGVRANAQTVPSNARIGEQAFDRGTSVATVAEASDFTAVADVAGSLSGTYFYFYSAGDAVCYQPWYDVDNGSTAPTAITGCTLVEVDIATADLATTVAGNTRTVLNASPYTTYFAITGATTHVIVTSLTKGTATDGNIGTSGFSVSKTQGVSSVEALADSEIVSKLMAWSICNDADNGSSDWLAVGKSALDADSDGVRLAEGECFKCPSCTAKTLRDAYVSSEGGSNGYSIVQYRE